jgi:ACS family hexuronate transporter-like MFS transporter
MTIAALTAPIGCFIAAGLPIPAVLGIAAVVSFAHLTWQVTMGALIVDMFPKRVLGTAFGFIAAGSGLGGMLSTGAIGWLVTHLSYTPVFLAMAALHPLALLVALRVRRVSGDTAP